MRLLKVWTRQALHELWSHMLRSASAHLKVKLYPPAPYHLADTQRGSMCWVCGAVCGAVVVNKICLRQSACACSSASIDFQACWRSIRLCQARLSICWVICRFSKSDLEVWVWGPCHNTVASQILRSFLQLACRELSLSLVWHSTSGCSCTYLHNQFHCWSFAHALHTVTNLTNSSLGVTDAALQCTWVQNHVLAVKHKWIQYNYIPAPHTYFLVSKAIRHLTWFCMSLDHKISFDLTKESQVAHLRSSKTWVQDGFMWRWNAAVAEFEKYVVCLSRPEGHVAVSWDQSHKMKIATHANQIKLVHPDMWADNMD